MARQDERVPLLPSARVPNHRGSSIERRARSYCDAELREVIVSNGVSPSNETSVGQALSFCALTIIDYDVDKSVEHRSIVSYNDAPPCTMAARVVCVEHASAYELGVISESLEMYELRSLPSTGTVPRVEVYDEHRILIAVEAPVSTSTHGDTASQSSQANPVPVDAWTIPSDTPYVPVVLLADTVNNVLVIVHMGDSVGACSLRMRLAGALRNNLDDVRKHSIVHLLTIAATFLVDRFYPVLEAESELLDSVEAALLSDGELALHRDIVCLIARTKRTMLGVRRRLWPFRRCLARLSLAPLRSESMADRYYTRSLLDHVVHLLDVLEVQRDAAHALLEVFLSAHNNRMQEVMTKIGVITTIFVPLTFLTGLEGMNFKFMPELDGRYSYFCFLLLVAAVVGTMVVWFRRRGWL